MLQNGHFSLPTTKYIITVFIYMIFCTKSLLISFFQKMPLWAHCAPEWRFQKWNDSLLMTAGTKENSIYLTNIENK